MYTASFMSITARKFDSTKYSFRGYGQAVKELT